MEETLAHEQLGPGPESRAKKRGGESDMMGRELFSRRGSNVWVRPVVRRRPQANTPKIPPAKPLRSSR